MKENDSLNKFWTIPNVITLFRIALIPVFIVFYFTGLFVPALVVIALSALSDILDGFIARKFNMVSKVGKAMDPIADKLSQFALMICLVVKFPHMIILMVLIFVKEITSGILGLVTMNKTGRIEGAVWHGKVTTIILYASMMLHIVWPTILPIVSDILIAVCSVMMVISFVLYTLRYIRMLKEGRPEEASESE